MCELCKLESHQSLPENVLDFGGTPVRAFGPLSCRLSVCVNSKEALITIHEPHETVASVLSRRLQSLVCWRSHHLSSTVSQKGCKGEDTYKPGPSAPIRLNLWPCRRSRSRTPLSRGSTCRSGSASVEKVSHQSKELEKQRSYVNTPELQERQS